MPPSGEAPKQAPRWDLVHTESCGGGIRFLAPYLIIWEFIVQRGGAGGHRGGHEVGGAPYTPRARPPPSWVPCCSTDVLLPPIYTYVPPNDQIRSQNPNSTTVTFCIHENPSWGLFRSSAGGGIDHGGLLHQHHSLSDEVRVVYHRPTGP